MNISLVCSQKSLLAIAKSSPWNPMAPNIVLKNTQNLKDRSKTAWKLHANAKGFGSTPVPAAIQESSIINKTSNKNNNNKSTEDEEIPQVVVNRIIVRILVSVGAPMALGLASLHFFGLIREQQLWDVPVWIPFMTAFLTFGTSAFGIAYGALSSSLDPNKKGSFLGFEEAQLNWVEMWKEEDECKK